MDLHLSGKTFAVGGATSGLGRAIAEGLLAEGATVIGIARTQRTLDEVGERFRSGPGSNRAGAGFEGYAADLTDATAVKLLAEHLIERDITGCVLNAGGPPTGTVDELDMAAWDEAYRSTLRWKVQLTRELLPMLTDKEGGRLLYVESVSIKQPIDGLVLSNAMRAAVAGFAKTLSREVGGSGLTVNLLAPGYHATPRINTVLEKSADLQGVDLGTIERQFTAETSLNRLGRPADLAALALYLLSPQGGYITGQTISVDGGLVRHITG